MMPFSIGRSFNLTSRQKLEILNDVRDFSKTLFAVISDSEIISEGYLVPLLFNLGRSFSFGMIFFSHQVNFSQSSNKPLKTLLHTPKLIKALGPNFFWTL